GKPGGGEDVALRERPGRDPLAHVLGKRDVPAGDSPAPGRRLPAHVDHPDLAHAREVYGVRPGDRPRSNALTPATPTRDETPPRVTKLRPRRPEMADDGVTPP